MDTSPAPHPRSLILIHWATLALMVVSFATHEVVEDGVEALARARLDGESLAEAAGAGVHIAAGVLVLALTLVRLGLRVWQSRSAAGGATANQAGLAERAAGAVHAALYGLLIALTLSGVAAWFEVGPDPDDLHEGLFNLTMLVIALHAGAALFHQIVLRDGVMARMAPRWFRARQG
jgi:cytochrome b561